LKIVKKFYHISISAEEGVDAGVALGPEGWNPYSIRYGAEAATDRMPRFKMAHGEFIDYQPGQVNFCSEKLMCVLEMNKAAGDVIDWFVATIEDAHSNLRNYYVLHIPVADAVLDETKTIFAGENREFVVRPHFMMEAIKSKHIFTYRGNINSWVVSAHMREKILEAGCIGLVFLEAEAS
jgi:hypothetical protein